MQYPKRKALRLKNYNYSQNGIYFITICTHGRACILGEVVGGDAHIAPFSPPSIQLSPYGVIAEKYIQRIPDIDNYVIMPNHIHFIIRLEGRVDVGIDPYAQTISQRIQSFKTLVTKEIGKKIWQRSFHDHIIRNEPEYLKIWDYIDQNPIKWQDDCYYSHRPKSPIDKSLQL